VAVAGPSRTRAPSLSVPDPYKVLQVDPEAEDEVIEAAYKRLARKYHPDVSRDPGSVERMVRINQAWEMLRDPVRRAAVDRARARAAGTSARVAATDGRQHAARRNETGGGARPQPAGAPPRASGPVGGQPPPWPFPGMVDPTAGRFDGRAERTSRNWTPGRSTSGAGFDTRSMGAGAAGPPPGNPSGSIVTFGRYEGWTLGEIARADLEYLEWLDRMPIGRTYQAEIDGLLRKHGRRVAAADPEELRGNGLFRRR
jgi:curved DNA-binding protein CbpA